MAEYEELSQRDLDRLFRDVEPTDLIRNGGKIYHSNLLKHISVVVYRGRAFPYSHGEFKELQKRERAILISELVHRFKMNWTEAGRLFGLSKERTWYWKKKLAFDPKY